MFTPILAYHKVTDDFDLSVTRVTPTQFERQISFLFQHGYKTISISDFVNQTFGDGKHVIITFDDAYASVYEHALPILRNYNYTATIFVITAYVNRWNDWDYRLPKNRNMHCSWEQLRSLAVEGWEIGSHTVSHRSLKHLSNPELRYELEASKAQLENELQERVNVLSYPFGKFNDRVIQLVKISGYHAACTLGNNVSGSREGRYTLERKGVYFFEPFSLFKVKLEEGFLARCDDKKQRAITFCSHGSILVQSLKPSKNIA